MIPWFCSEYLVLLSSALGAMAGTHQVLHAIGRSLNVGVFKYIGRMVRLNEVSGPRSVGKMR